MAHIGKVFPYLFRRDLGRFTGPMASLPQRMRWHPFLVGQGTLMNGWRNTQKISREADVDEDLGRVNYTFDPPPAANQNTLLEIEWWCTFDILMWEWNWKFFSDGQLMGECLHQRVACTEFHVETRNSYTAIVDFTKFSGTGASFCHAQPWE